MRWYEYTTTIRVGFSEGRGHAPHRTAQSVRRVIHALVASYFLLPKRTRCFTTTMRRVDGP